MVTGFEGFEVPGDKYSVISFPPVTGSGVKDVFIAEDRYAVLATQSGVDIVDLFCGQVISNAVVGGTEVLSVAVADTLTTFTGCLYMGTSTSGILATIWAPLRFPGRNFTGDVKSLYSTTSTLALSSDRINDLAIQGGNVSRLLVSTSSGVDFLYIPREGPQLISTRPLLSGSNSCELTASNEGYWTVVNSGVEANYDLIATTGTGAISVDAEYNNTSSVPLLPHNIVNDLAISEGSPNIINVATASGDFLIEEVQGSESSAQSKTLNPGVDVVSVDFSDGATFATTGTKYVTTTGVVTVFGLVDTTVSGTHHQEIASEEKFDKENTRDQALITGTINKIRVTSVA